MRGEETRLGEEIRRAFPVEVFYGPVTECSCEECTDIRNNLSHKRWDEVPGAFLDLTRSPVLPSKEAFAYFLPAYLLRALEDLKTHPDRPQTLEYTLYSLCPSEDDPYFRSTGRLRERAALMTAEQIEVVRRFLRFVALNAAEGQREWFGGLVDRGMECIWIS